MDQSCSHRSANSAVKAADRIERKKSESKERCFGQPANYQKETEFFFFEEKTFQTRNVLDLFRSKPQVKALNRTADPENGSKTIGQTIAYSTDGQSTPINNSNRTRMWPSFSPGKVKRKSAMIKSFQQRCQSDCKKDSHECKEEEKRKRQLSETMNKNCLIEQEERWVQARLNIGR